MCLPNEFLWSEDDQCHECQVAGCHTCKLGKCTSCKSGLILNNGHCIINNKINCGYGRIASKSGGCEPCHRTCENCYGPGPDQCLRCREGSNDDSTIIRNQTTCIKASIESIRSGSSCGVGRGLGLNGVCDACPGNCDSCVPDLNFIFIPTFPTVFSCLVEEKKLVAVDSSSTSTSSSHHGVSDGPMPLPLAIFIGFIGFILVAIAGLKLSQMFNSCKQKRLSQKRVLVYNSL